VLKKIFVKKLLPKITITSKETFTRETCTSPYELWVIILPHLGQCMWRRLLWESHPEISVAFLGLVGAAGFGLGFPEFRRW